jgi:hypothetical protein
MAALFYSEAMATYDIGVFAWIPAQHGSIVRLTENCDWCRRHGFEADMEHVVIHTVPIQFLAANEGVKKEAVERARVFDYHSVAVPVMAPEYLAVLSILADGPRRRERTASLFEAGAIDRGKLRDILERHALADQWRDKAGYDV